MKNKRDNPNLRTKAWGPPAWFYLHCVTMGYPAKNPTEKQRKNYRMFFKYIGDTLPCNLCRNSYKKYLKELPLTDKVLNCRKNLVFWLFKIHNKVNEKLKCKILNKTKLKKKFRDYDKFRAMKCSSDMAGCMKAEKGVTKPKKIKLIKIDDTEAIKKKKNKKKKFFE
jgi:hypothetical protein